LNKKGWTIKVPPFFIANELAKSTQGCHLSDLVTGQGAFTLTSSPACCILLKLLNQFLPIAPEAESLQLFLWRTLQDQVEQQSLNGGFTGNSSVFLFSKSHDFQLNQPD
jgi:hypothetical protein